MDRITLLWALALFFGSSIAFRAVQSATSSEPRWVTFAAEVVLLAAIVTAVVVVVRRRGDQ